MAKKPVNVPGESVDVSEWRLGRLICDVTALSRHDDHGVFCGLFKVNTCMHGRYVC